MAYGSVDELKVLLRIDSPSTLQVEAMERCLDAATEEIDSELGYTEPPDPVPALVREVCLERAHDHWKAGQSPFGAVLLAETPVVAARNSWARHRSKLWPLKQTWGVA